MNYKELRERLIKNKKYDIKLIDSAYQCAESAHKGQMRDSGDEYITHPVEVAALLADMELDTESICAALLHDVVEDTGVEIEDVKRDFGAEVANLVDGVTKLGRIPFSSVEEQQAENLRKMLLAMSHDIRVILIKLCDRLHNMRTISARPANKRSVKALETMEVYAPIAHRLGMNNMKEELEDLSIAELDPVGCTEIKEYLEQNDAGGSDFVKGKEKEIITRITQAGIRGAEVSSRVKSLYGIYRKVFIQDRSFESVYDIYALRLIVDSVADCYNALGVIHDMYHPIPNRFKDYISTPKPNMYQSLHTTVLASEGIPFEIQIRTRDMHYTAEYGVAAHWKYKAGISGKDKLDERLEWVRQLLESQKESEDAVDILANIKSDLLPEEVYVFTPKGDVINLPAGSTVIDFAYAIHSAVGNRMIGAKVDGRMVPIDFKIKTGMIVEVVTGPKDKGPSRDWLNIVKTSEAKNKIRNWFKKERRDENIVEGRKAVEKEIRRNMIHLPADMYDSFMEDIAKRQKLHSAEEMYAAIGYGGLTLARIMPKIKDEYQKLSRTPELEDELKILAAPKKSTEGVVIDGMDDCLVKFAHCCNPLPGDPIVGFVTRGHGVSIHKRDCANVQAALALDDTGRWLEAEWASNVKTSYKTALEIIALDRDGLFADVSVALSNLRIPIYAVNARTSDGRAFMTVSIGVNNIDHLRTVVSKLNRIKDVESVERINS